MNIRYNFTMNGQEFDALWNDDAVKKDLVDDAFTLVNDFVFDAIHQISDHRGQRSDQSDAVRIKDPLNEAKLYWQRKDLLGTFELIENTAQLVVHFRKVQDDQKVADMVVSEDNKYFVLYLQSSVLYPADKDITSLDWSEILTRPPAPAAPAQIPPDVVATRMANDMAKIAVNSSHDSDLKNLRSLPLDYTNFPTDVKEQFIRRQAKVPIRRSEVFHTKRDKSVVYQKYKNGLEKQLPVIPVRLEISICYFSSNTQTSHGQDPILHSPNDISISFSKEDS